jgi:hypothetical protein
MKILLAIICLIPFTLSAQSDADRISALELKARIQQAKIDTLLSVIGDFHTVIPCSELDANRPALVLGDGGYPERFRLKQIGCAIDSAVTLVGGFQTQLSGLASRIASIESSVAGGQPVGTAVFDIIRARKVCIDRDCDPDWNAALQIRGGGLANIGLEGNLDHIDPQDPTHSHVSQFNVSTDGGTRIQQNCKSTYSRGYVCYVNPCRESLNFGPDSRSSVSIYVASVNEQTCTPIPHDGAQDFVFMTDEVNRRSVIFLSRPNWKLEFKLSSTIHAGDISILPAPQP